ncbi:MAG TPA: hypothetical protein VNL16_04660 [Chloroflexota bacterium]|nr:hypothetical protein [Chloroflexota bacterium]
MSRQQLRLNHEDLHLTEHGEVLVDELGMGRAWEAIVDGVPRATIAQAEPVAVIPRMAHSTHAGRARSIHDAEGIFPASSSRSHARYA